MAAKKKTTKKKAVRKTAKKTATRRPAAPSATEESLSRIEGRLAALEAQPDAGRELRELRLALLPALESYRASVRAKGDVGLQMPYVMAGIIVIILIVVGVLASNDVLSADAAGILIGGTLVYAVVKLRRYLLD